MKAHYVFNYKNTLNGLDYFVECSALVDPEAIFNKMGEITCAVTLLGLLQANLLYNNKTKKFKIKYSNIQSENYKIIQGMVDEYNEVMSDMMG